MGSSGYGSHGSNGSHEQLVSMSSSSESNGNVMSGITAEDMGKLKLPRTFQEICKDIHMQKNQESQVCLQSLSSSALPPKPEQRKSTDSESTFISSDLYQLISLVTLTSGCLFTVNQPLYFFSSHYQSSASAQKSPTARLKHSAPPLLARDGTATTTEDISCKDQNTCSYQQISCLDSVIR